MIDIVEKYDKYDVSTILPALNEFEERIRDIAKEIDHTDFNNKLLLEAKIYGDLIQTMDKYGLRTYGLATTVRKYYSYFVVDIILTETKPITIREISIPIKQNHIFGQ